MSSDLGRPAPARDHAAPAQPGGAAVPPLAYGAVHVWEGEVPAEASAADLALLSRHEHDRSLRMAHKHGGYYAGSHAAVRRVLADYLDLAPGAIQLGRLRCPGCGAEDHGPPAVTGVATPLRFSFSRSGAHWLLALTHDRPVGIDIERVGLIDAARVAPMVLSPDEQAHFAAHTGEAERLDVFLRCWTRKEAVVKASGIGLAAELREVDVQPAHRGPVPVRHGAPGGPDAWVVQDLPVGPGLLAALAVQAGHEGAVVRCGSPASPSAHRFPSPSTLTA
jgi:4'-phosphopantetheinyl transferase